MIVRTRTLAVAVVVAVLAPAALAVAGGHGTTAGGMTTPCGATGCGPRYWGAQFDEPLGPDPCDRCGNWRGCGGVRTPERLAPWQLPPGCGFTLPAGAPAPCAHCSAGCRAGR